MNLEEVRNYFGSYRKACLQLRIASQNVTAWRQKGYIPLKQQFKIALLTEGELMPDDEDPTEKLKPLRKNARNRNVEDTNHASC